MTDDTKVVASTAVVTLNDDAGTAVTAAELSAIGGKTSGAVTVSNAVAITGDHDQVTAALVTADTLVEVTDATVTINDDAGTAVTAAELSAIGGKTSGQVTVSNAVAITGNAAQVTAALVTADTLVVASTAAVTITGNPSIAELNAIAAKTDGVVTATLAATSLASLADLTTAGTDNITITVSDDAGDAVTASDLSTLGGKTAGTVTVTNAVAITGDHDQVTAALVTDDTKVVASTAVVTLNDDAGTSITAAELSAIGGKTSGTVTVTNAINITGSLSETTAALHTDSSKVTASTANVTITALASDDGNYSNISNKTSGTVTYNISDTVTNLNSASTNNLHAASVITGTDNAGSSGSTVDLEDFTSLSNLDSMTLTGDTGVNQVELSKQLSQSNKTTIDFVSDGAADRLIFNLANDSDFVEFDSDGTIKSGSSSSFTFNKLNNFDIAGEDLLGVFYGGKATQGIYSDISATSTAFSMKLFDGIIYEDNFNSGDGLYLTNANASDALTIKNNIGMLIQSGGSGFITNNRGSDSLDFTYVLYGQSSDDASTTSAYVYAGTYGTQNTMSGNFAADQLKIVGLAEIVGVADGSLVSDSITSSKGDLA